MTVCFQYIPTGNAIGEIYTKISLWSFLLLLYFLEMDFPRTWHLSLESEHPPRALHCWFTLSICSCFDNFAATEHHQYHLEQIVLLNKSLVKSPQFGVVLIALGDSRGCRYRRPALLLGLFCFVMGLIFFTITCPHCSQISGPLKGALYRYCILVMCKDN